MGSSHAFSWRAESQLEKLSYRGNDDAVTRIEYFFKSGCPACVRFRSEVWGAIQESHPKAQLVERDCGEEEHFDALQKIGGSFVPFLWVNGNTSYNFDEARALVTKSSTTS